MKISLWPGWLPHPISCFKGLVLSYAFTSTVKSQFPLQSAESLAPILITGWIWVTLLFSFSSWAAAFLVNLLLAHLPQKPSLDNFRRRLTIWSSTKQPPWKEGLNAFIISLVTSFFVSFVVFSLFRAPDRQGDYELRQIVIQVRFGLIPIGMTLASAYLYQYDLWVRQRRGAKQKGRSQTFTTPSPVEPRVKPTKLAAPEVADWYVFRSGKAEGPYTKLQLWEVQSITARTKVRRGEADWQRAGEISELTKYLSEK